MRMNAKCALPFAGATGWLLLAVAALAVFFAVMTAALASPARAATLTVSNTNDSGGGSLRQAIDTANSNG